MANANGAIGWDDEVSAADAGEGNQNDDIVVLPEGIYPCKILKIERGSFNGSKKLPPCNKVKIGIIIEGGELGRGWADTNFYMHTTTLYKIYQFLEALGLRKKGDTTAASIPWSKVKNGMTCRCEVTTREWNDKEYNEVKKWLPDEQTDEAADAGDNQESLSDSDF